MILSIFDAEWHRAEKKVDPNFAGSLWEYLGYDDKLCPTCRAHLFTGICLNACHLSATSRKRFNSCWDDLWKDISDDEKK